jgi:GDP-L-fucose synthase
MNRNSRIYIAGHSGLVGSAILRRLRADGFTNLITRSHTELDLRRQDETETFFEQQKPDYVFLAAARVGGILANSTYKADFIYDNIMIAANVIHATFRYGVKKLLNLGSSCIYPKNAPQPLKEEYLLTDTLESTNEPYALAKIAAIKLCRYYDEQYGTNFRSVMPTNLYGPDDNFDLETSHVLPALIRKFHLAKLATRGDWEAIKRDEELYGPIPENIAADLCISKNRKSYQLSALSHEPVVTVWGTGEPYREFLHVDDLADACVFLMERYDSKDIGEFVNIGTGEDLKIKDLANLVKEVVGFDGDITYDTSKPDGTPRKLLDIGKINLLGWAPRISLNEGIDRTYDWYLYNSKGSDRPDTPDRPKRPNRRDRLDRPRSG